MKIDTFSENRQLFRDQAAQPQPGQNHITPSRLQNVFLTCFHIALLPKSMPGGAFLRSLDLGGALACQTS